MNKTLYATFIAVFPTLLLTGCDNVAEMVGVDSRPTVEIQGKLTVTMAMGGFDPNKGVSLGPSGVLVDYKPGQSAVIYTDDDTEFVNLEHNDEYTNYQLGKQYLVRGYDVQPEGVKNPDGTETIRTISGVDRWIEATHVELLEGQSDEEEN